ncbi:MAG: class I SAM-dependent methyltransferase [Chitinophagales bacterium]
MIKKWHIKAVVQKTISWLPYKHSINYLFQRYVTRGVLLTDALFTDKLEHLRFHIEKQRKYSHVPCDVLEIGTGWYPVIPLGMLLAGNRSVSTFDIVQLVTSQQVRDTLRCYVRWHEAGKLESYIPNYDHALIEKFRDVLKEEHRDPLLEFGIQYVSGNFPDAFKKPEAFDHICSNNTFEHIYENALRETLSIFRKILKPNGVMSHHIDMSDHFAHLDKTITPFNFLQFNDADWQWIDNTVQPQNRLRCSDFEKMIREAGFEILEEHQLSGSLHDLAKISLAQKYSHYRPEDLAVTHVYFTCR